MIYKAKPKPHNYGRYDYDWLVDLLDEEGYVHGYYVDGYIVGDIAEVTEDYIHLEYWVPIEKDTLTQVEKEEQKYIVVFGKSIYNTTTYGQIGKVNSKKIMQSICASKENIITPNQYTKSEILEVKDGEDIFKRYAVKVEGEEE